MIVNLNDGELFNPTVTVQAQGEFESIEDFLYNVKSNMFIGEVWGEIPYEYWETKFNSLENGEISYDEIVNGTFTDYAEVFQPHVDGYKANLYYRYGISQEDLDNLSTADVFAMIQQSGYDNNGVVDLEYVASQFPSYNPEVLNGD